VERSYRSLEKPSTNVGFLRARIEFIERLFGPGEVEEIWITFPDPQPKNRKNV
jgi:tRNA (guanine-N7-)-methyltransferase